MAQDNVLRVEKKSNYKTIDLYALKEDDRLSPKACGLHSYLVTQPPGWKFYKSDIISRFSVGRAAVDSGLKELKKYGYLSIERSKNEKGQFDGWEWTVRERPVDHQEDSRNPKNPISESANVGESSPTNKDNTNKKVSKPNSSTSRNEDVDWQNLTPPQRLAKSTPNRPCPRIAEVFQWCRDYREKKLNKGGGRSITLTDLRHRKIRARLDEFDVDELKKAYKSMLHNDYHVEENYTYPENCFRNDNRVETHLDQYDDRVNSSSTSNLIESDKERYLN